MDGSKTGFIAIYHHDYKGRWYWVLRESLKAVKISPCDNTSEELCRAEIKRLQDKGELPKFKVIDGGFQEPLGHADRPLCEE